MDRYLNACPVCASTQFSPVREATATANRIVLCDSCGLLFANPTMRFDQFDAFYDEEFTGDAGSKAARANGKSNSSKKASKLADDFALPLLKHHFGELKGKQLLEFRCRHGLITQAVTGAGASVVATDPMIENVKSARANGADALELSISRHLTLEGFEDNSFDGVYALAVHVLAHLPDPVQFLRSVLRVLKPGGRLVFDEKDIFEIGTHGGYSVFESGAAHLFHLTYDSAYNMLTAAGFNVVAIDRAGNRRTAFRHMVLVAEKPKQPIAQPSVFRNAGAVHIRTQIKSTERKLRVLGPFNYTVKRSVRLVRSLVSSRANPG